MFAAILFCCAGASVAQKAVLFDRVEIPDAGQVAVVAPASRMRVARATLETEILNEINALRRDPASYAARLAEYKRYFVGKELRLPNQVAILTDEGATALDEAIAVLKQTKPAQNFVDDENLTRAAADHARDIAITGKIGHYDSRGASPAERVARYGVWRGEMHELVSQYPATARQIVFNLIVDDGVKSRGHRRALLKSNLRVAGIKTGDSRALGKLCVIVLAESFFKKS